jgi:23S rRNA (cytosine1962-C5)-methyltransferase
LFADSVREQNRAGLPGEIAVVYDRNDKFLAVGLYEPNSPLRLRVLHAGKPVTIDESWWRENLTKAIRRREGLFNEQTNGFRWINGESDGWPGLVLDRYADVLVLKIYTAAWLPRLTEIRALICDVLKPKLLVLRLSRNIQEIARLEFQLEDGLEITTNLVGDDVRRLTSTQKGQRLLTSSPTGCELSPVIFLETGLRFEADVHRGQKTGFFLDQRENRRRVETLARDCHVLNAFSFSGGFSLYAARGGAKSVTDLDLSAHALESANRNFALNHGDTNVAACRHQTIQADAFAWLAQNDGHKFDLIILDPPSLAKREAECAGAIQAYEKLAANGLRALRRDGVLMAASCSAHVSAEEFFAAIRRAAQKSSRRFIEMETTAHPPDHPATFPEARYLKCIYLRM